MTVDQMIRDRGPEVIKGHQDLKELPVELLRHLKRISGSKVLVCLLLNSFAVYSVVTDSKVLKLSIKITEIDGSQISNS